MKRVSVGLSIGAALLLLVILSCDSGGVGGFEQVGYYKKDYHRVYSYWVKDFEETDAQWAAVEEYAKSRMWSEGGFTAVLFFADRENTPDVTYTGLEFPEAYEPHCIAGFWKIANGSMEFRRYPFK